MYAEEKIACSVWSIPIQISEFIVSSTASSKTYSYFICLFMAVIEKRILILYVCLWQLLKNVFLFYMFVYGSYCDKLGKCKQCKTGP